MARSLGGLLYITIALGCCVATAEAAIFANQDSVIKLKFGFVNMGGPTALPGTVEAASLLDDGFGGHAVVITSTVFSTVNYSGGTSLWAEVPQIEDVRMTFSFPNSPATFTTWVSGIPNRLYHDLLSTHPLVSGFGGWGCRMNGNLLLDVIGFPHVYFDLSHVGGSPGETSVNFAGGIPIRMTFFGPWVTAPVLISNITTNVISVNGVTGAAITLSLTTQQEANTLTSNGIALEYHTVTILGDNYLISAEYGGSITMVSPIRIHTTPAIMGSVPGVFKQRLVFVPEPSTILVTVFGGVGLIVLGRRRTRR